MVMSLLRIVATLVALVALVTLVDGQEPTPPTAPAPAGAETKPDQPKADQPKADEPNPDAEAARAERVATARRKMKYFQSHVGEWVGTETYETVATGQKVTIKDEWKGSYSLGGSVFEMQGHSEGPFGKSNYKWMITYDVEDEAFYASVYDDEGSVTDYVLTWDEEEKTLLWSSEDEDNDRVSELLLKAEGHEIHGEGTVNQLSDGVTMTHVQMSYRKKVISI
jgi:hypothetical protein